MPGQTRNQGRQIFTHHPVRSLPAFRRLRASHSNPRQSPHSLQRALYKDIPTARPWNHGRPVQQLRQRRAVRKYRRGARHPGRVRSWKCCGDFARSAQDAHADGAADRYGEAKTDAEYAEKGPAFLTNGLFVMRRGFGSLWVGNSRA
jgi:hypothetical protein